MTLSATPPFLTIHVGTIVSIGELHNEPGDLCLRIEAAEPLELFVDQEIGVHLRDQPSAFPARVVQVSTQRIWLQVDWDHELD